MPFYILVLIAVIITFAAAFQPTAAPQPPHYVISDNDGNILSTVSVKVTPGDEFLSAQNDLYIITEVRHNLARAQFIRKIYLH